MMKKDFGPDIDEDLGIVRIHRPVGVLNLPFRPC